MQQTMRRVLLVKTSSLGDVVHNLPLVNDIRSQYPDVAVDWVVEAAFTAIARLHAGVGNVIPVSIRRWRRELLQARTLSECGAFVRRLRAREYDAIIDTQGLLKSALITCAARGASYGLDWKSSREPLRFLYERTFRVPWGQHAVERNRSLAAQALGYTLDAPANYGITSPRLLLPWLPAQRYAVLLHATSAERKLWPENHWVDIYKMLISKEIIPILPWGNASERARSERLVTAMPRAVVPPLLALEDMAALLAQAQAVVGVDTGLTHLAGALNVPTVGIYCATDSAATGVYGCPRAVNLGGVGAPPLASEVIATLNQLGVH